MVNGPNVAVYIDFENLAISAENQYPEISKPLRLDLIMDFASSHGNICIKKAYADWSKPPCSNYVGDLASYAFELVYLPQITSMGKNGADLRMTMDAMEDLQTINHVDMFIIGSGDTDFIHLIRKIQQRGKLVVVMGFERSVGPTIRDNSNEFKAIDDLMGEMDKASVPSFEEGFSDYDGRDLLIRYIRSRSKSADEGINLSSLKTDLLRLQSDFKEKKFGFKSFREFIKSYEGDVVDRVEQGQTATEWFAYLKDWSEIVSSTDDGQVKKYVDSQLKILEPETRKVIIERMLDMFKEKQQLSMNEIADEIFEKLGKKASKRAVKNFLWALGGGRVLKQAETKYTGSTYTMPQLLVQDGLSVDSIEDIYRERMIGMVMRKYPGTSISVIQNAVSKKPLC